MQARHRCGFGPVNSWICTGLTHGLYGWAELQDAQGQRRSAMDGCSLQYPAANKDHAGVLVEMFSGSRAGPPDQDRLRQQSFAAGNRCPNSASACAAQSSDRQSLSAAAGTIGRGELHEIKHARARVRPSRIDSKLRHRQGAVFFLVGDRFLGQVSTEH